MDIVISFFNTGLALKVTVYSWIAEHIADGITLHRESRKKQDQTLLWQCIAHVHLHYAKFEYKGMKTVGITDFKLIRQS